MLARDWAPYRIRGMAARALELIAGRTPAAERERTSPAGPVNGPRGINVPENRERLISRVVPR